MSVVTIRPGRPDDIAFVDPIDASGVEMFARHGQPLPDGSQDPLPGHWEAVQAAGLLWIADDQARPVGFLAGALVEDGLYIEQVSVAVESQRRGIGRRLMLAAIDRARAERLPAVSLTTFRDIPWNAPFYASLGFVEAQPSAMPAHLAARLADEAANGFTGRCAMRLAL